MNGKLAEAQDVLLSRVDDICNKFGLNSVMAQIYTILYLSGKPLSLNDMVERLEISKASVSINVRALERYGAVKSVWVKGSRRDFYAAEPDIYKVIIDRVKSMSQRRLGEVDTMIKDAYGVLNTARVSSKEEKEAMALFKERLDALRDIYNKGQSLFNLFNSGLANNFLGNKLLKHKKEATYAPSQEL